MCKTVLLIVFFYVDIAKELDLKFLTFSDNKDRKGVILTTKTVFFLTLSDNINYQSFKTFTFFFCDLKSNLKREKNLVLEKS